jgi:hypothetical protein
MVTNPSKSKMEDLESAMLSDRTRLPPPEKSESDNSDDDRRSEKSVASRKSDKSNKSEKSDKSDKSERRSVKQSDVESDDEDKRKTVQSDDDSDDGRQPKSVASVKSFHNSEARMSTTEMATRVSVPNSTYTRASRNSQHYDSDDQSVLSDNITKKNSVPPLAPLDNRSDVGSNVSRLPSNKEQEILEKQSVLLDMERLKLQGIQFTKVWTLNDRLDDMHFELRRHLLHLDEINNMNFLRDGLRMACTGFEVLNRRWGLLELDGWSQEVCRDMSRYDNSMSRLYRKYWRRTSTTSPEMELGLALMGSVGMYHFKQKMSSQMFSSGPSIPRPSNVPMQMPNSSVNVDDSSDDENEGLPP